jgi:hypothetical protein
MTDEPVFPEHRNPHLFASQSIPAVRELAEGHTSFPVARVLHGAWSPVARDFAAGRIDELEAFIRHELVRSVVVVEMAREPGWVLDGYAIRRELILAWRHEMVWDGSDNVLIGGGRIQPSAWAGELQQLLRDRPVEP